MQIAYRDVVKPSLKFRQETIEAIDPVNKQVVTDQSSYDADVLVVALGADVVPELTPVWSRAGNTPGPPP